MIGAIGLNRDTKRHRVGVVARCLELVVIKLNDVGALLGEQCSHLDQLARGIRQLDLEVHDAAAGDHTLLNHGADGHGIDVAAGHNRHYHVRAGGGSEFTGAQVQMFQRSQGNGTAASTTISPSWRIIRKAMIPATP